MQNASRSAEGRRHQGGIAVLPPCHRQLATLCRPHVAGTVALSAAETSRTARIMSSFSPLKPQAKGTNKRGASVSWTLWVREG